VQYNVEGIVDGGSFAFGAQIGGHGLWLTEEYQRLIEQVWSQIEP